MLVRPLDLSTLKAFLIHIESPRFAEDFNNAGKKPLYHYTDLGGFTGIVAHHDLWLTNARFSNDDREMTHGYDIAREVIDAAVKTTPLDGDYLEEVLRLLDPAAPESVYISCFCEEDNLLSQWRGYGANGTGVSLKLDASEFSWALGPDMPLGVMRLWKVYYDEAKQRSFVTDALQFGRSYQPAGDALAKARNAADAIKFFIPTFKHKDFKEEGEWRLIFSPGPQCTVPPDFRVARQILVPYFSLRKLLDAARQTQLAQLPIRNVMIGPSPRGRLNKESAELMLATAGYANVPVGVSSTSYRS